MKATAVKMPIQELKESPKRAVGSGAAGPFAARAITTIVQVTPVALQSDSRTYKQAETLARAGYRSVVLEGKTSITPPAMSFELFSPNEAASAPVWEAGTATAPQVDTFSVRRMITSTLRKCGLGIVVDLAISALDVRYFMRLQSARRWGAVPSGDLYILHSSFYYPMVKRLAASNGARILYDAHDAYFDLSPDGDNSNPRFRRLRSFYELVERRCVRRADVFLTVSKGVADLIDGRYGRRPLIVRNMHDPRLDRASELSVRRAAGVREKDFLFVSVGNYKPGMAISQALRALQDCAENVHVAFLGLGYDQIRSEVESCGLSSRVHLMSPMPPDQIIPFIRDADAALLTYFGLTSSYDYLFPNGFFQALAAELPLVCPVLREMRTVVEREKTGIVVDPTQWTEVRDAMKRLSEDADCFNQFKAAAKAAAPRYSWEREETHFLSAVNSSLGRRSGIQ